MRTSIGIMAYNEGKNISVFLDSLFTQEDFEKLVSEIIIISSGSTDKTNSIVQRYAKKYRKIRFYKETKRSGKASAVNTFLTKAKENIVVLVSADLILKKTTLKDLLKPFRTKNVGITGAHPVPINNEKTLMGFASHLLWRLHHEVSLKSPKMGEMIAFRKVFKQIPVLSSVDEANIEPLVRGQGYKAVYVPTAIVFNKGPETIREFVARRRHIYYGHLATKHEYSYEVSTIDNMKVVMFLFSNMKLNIQHLFFTPVVIMLEVYSRFLGYLDYKFKIKTHTVWEVTSSTKDLRRAFP